MRSAGGRQNMRAVKGDGMYKVLDLKQTVRLAMFIATNRVLP